MEEAGYNITEKEFMQISKWAENIYNIAVIVDYFVSNQPEIEECYNLAPVIKNLRYAKNEPRNIQNRKSYDGRQTNKRI